MRKRDEKVTLPLLVLTEIERIAGERFLGYSTVEEFITEACRHELRKAVEESVVKTGRELSRKSVR